MTVFLLTDPVPRYHVDAVSEYIIINNYKHLLTSFRLILTLKKKAQCLLISVLITHRNVASLGLKQLYM